MARRKGEKEALRRERERRAAEARAAERRKRLVGYGGGGLLAIVAIVLIVLLAGGGGGSEGQGGGDVFPEGGEVAEQTEFDLETSAEDGLYYEAPTDEQLVHNLEHGRVVLWVKPSLPRDVRETIGALFEEDEYQMVVVPRRNMEPAVAATAWNRDPDPGGTGQTLSCPEWNDQVPDAIRTFRDEHRSNGPEPVP